MTTHDHTWQDCPDLNPTCAITLVRPWVPLLRALRNAGWEHKEYGGDTALEHVWRRGGMANLEQITVNLSAAKVYIRPWTCETTVLTVGDAWLALAFVGAFGPAPERMDWRRAS